MQEHGYPLKSLNTASTKGLQGSERRSGTKKQISNEIITIRGEEGRWRDTERERRKREWGLERGGGGRVATIAKNNRAASMEKSEVGGGGLCGQ